MIQTWRLDSGGQTLALSSRDGRLAEVIYWGPRLPAREDLATIACAAQADITGGMLDETPLLSVCPSPLHGFPGQPGLFMSDLQGRSVTPDLRLQDVESGGDRLVLRYRDDARNLGYTARFVATPETGVIEARAEFDCPTPHRLIWLAAPVLPAPQTSTEMIDFAGRWCGEFQTNRTPWSAGARLRQSRTGRTGHEHFPGLILPSSGATNTQGEVWALHYGWSGGHRMVAEELPDGRRQIQFGNAEATELEPSTHFETAPLYLAYSDHGLNGTATAFQRHLRDHIVAWPDRNRPRPVHYNCWEAVYFRHDVAELKAIATRAAALGAERFVLDDGWFGRRDDDTTSLGDWIVDARKYPEGLGPLIDHIHALGMTFGIWFEPEMVNPDSDLYRAHPDWALGDRDQILGRNQMVLDMNRPEVRDYLHERIAAVLSAYPVDYVKWDHNRVLPAPDARQTRGTYALLDRLRASFPALEIESCASGGARIDFGMMERTQRVWLSDSNDALERARIQHNAALFLPQAVTGSHVGPRHCHTSGRVLDIRLRAWVAAQRHMGFEVDPRELTEDEARVLTEVTAWWKANRHWTHDADILRLDSTDPTVIAEEQLALDGSCFVVFSVNVAASDQILPRPLRLTGLEPEAIYRVELRDRGDRNGISRGTVALKDGPTELSGRFLMNHGLLMPSAFPQTIWVIEGTRL